MLIISDKGQLFTFGDGRHGKLGLGEENFANQFKPSQVSRFTHFWVEEVNIRLKYTTRLALLKVYITLKIKKTS